VADIAEVIAGAGGDPVGFRKGTVLSWNNTTGENIIDVGGTPVTNMAFIASSAEVAQIAPGDSVGILTWLSSAFIIGRISRPGTPEAASAPQIQTVSATIAAACSTTAGAFGDPNTSGSPGPAVSANIGPSGRAMVTVGAAVGYQGLMSFAVSGASTRAASSSEALTASGVAASGTSVGASRRVLVEGLTPGVNVFTAKYMSATGGVVAFLDRNITVEPL